MIKHSCTIDYYLFGLWASFEKDPLTINNEIENLSNLEENYEHYSVICELINLIDSNNWAKAKYFWLHDHLKLEPSQNEYDCFGYTEDFFIKGLHKLQEYKLKYFFNCQSRSIEMSTLFFNTITIDQCTQLKTPCETICDICQKEECESIIFKQDPIWLFIKADPFKRKAKIDSFKKLIEFENGSKHSFPCVVFKIENQAQFASIFALNNGLFLINDLKSSYDEVTGDVEVMSDSFIYIKKFD